MAKKPASTAQLPQEASPSELTHGDTALPVHDLSTMVSPEALGLEPFMGDPARLDDSERSPETPLPHEPLPVTIVLPELAPEPGPGFCQRHVDCKLNNEEAAKFRRLRDALQREGTCLLTGKEITTPGDIVRWLLQQIPA